MKADMQSKKRRLNCRACEAPLSTTFVDLGLSPISNAFPLIDADDQSECIFPLKAMVCDACYLVQVDDVVGRHAHFNDDYAYFSSFSTSWLEHARLYAEASIARFSLTAASNVVEVASNDGYLLRHYVERGIPCLGVDPAGNCAEAAKAFGVETEVGFFGSELAGKLLAEGCPQADLMIANNVLAHVPDLHDFISGFSRLLKPTGSITFEVPHLLAMIKGNEFDTIYHEHYCYVSLLSLRPLLGRHGLAAYDTERLPTHGGSLRIYVAPVTAGRSPSPELEAVVADEIAAGLDKISTYRNFRRSVEATKRELLSCLIDLKRQGASICGYGAPAKGTTLLNYCGIGSDFLDFTVDRNWRKQGRRVPGTGVEIRAPDAIRHARPDYVVILPWNLTDEIIRDLAYIREWGGQFIVLIPRPSIIP